MTRDEAVEEVEFLTSLGESPLRIAERFGIQPASVARTLMRAGRHDLARPFARVEPQRDHHRKHSCADCGAQTARARHVRCRPCELRRRWGAM